MNTRRTIVLLIIIIAVIHTALLAVNIYSRSKPNESAKIKTASELAEKLKNEGIDYQTAEAVDINKLNVGWAKVDEGIALKGSDLWVEILRIEDERTFKMFGGVGLFEGSLNNYMKDKSGKESQGVPKNILAKKPFIITIRVIAQPPVG